MLDDATLAARLGAAVLLGGLVGLEREIRGRRAGLRTHIMVSLGACLFTLTSLIAEQQVGDEERNVQVDVTRIASQIVVGVGFLGGGAILRHGATVRGLTTAASLWVTAALGLASGFGFYRGGFAAAAIALFCLAGLSPIERRFVRDRRRRKHGRSTPSESGPRGSEDSDDDAPFGPV